MQYELETARHLECQRQAAHGRVAAEAEELAPDDKPSAPFLRSLFDWCVTRATLVRGGAV
jgi:hypothetical protein